MLIAGYDWDGTPLSYAEICRRVDLCPEWTLVARSERGVWLVSTVFLPFALLGGPRFETLVYYGDHDRYIATYKTLEGAEEGHLKVAARFIGAAA